MGMPEQQPQNGMNIAPDGTIYEILEDGTIKRIGKVSSNGEFEPFGGPKDGVRVRDGFIYRVINGKEQKIGRILPNGEIESISQRINSEAEISGNKVKIVAILSVLIAFIIGAGIYLFEEEQEVKDKRTQERMKDEEYENKIKPVVDEYLQEMSPKAEKLNFYIEKLKLLQLSLKYEENKKKAYEIISNIKSRKADIDTKIATEEERKKQEAEAKKAEEERRSKEETAIVKTQTVVGKATVGKTEVDGAVDSASVSKTIRGSSIAVKRCYDKALLVNPTLKGKVSVTILINEKGRVESVEISEDTIKDAEVVKCIKGVVSRLRFPKPDGGPASVTFPFVFSKL